MAGHVFIIRGDLTRLHCDAWLMPTDRHLSVRGCWLRGIPGLPRAWTPGKPDRHWLNRKRRVMKVRNWPLDVPAPWLVNTGAWKGTSSDWYLDGVKQFFAEVVPFANERRLGGVAENGGKSAGVRRSKPLIALPLVGTGGGGAREIAGKIVRELLPILREMASSHDVDIVLVTCTGPAFAAAMNCRNEFYKSKQFSWPEELTDDLRKKADLLADFIRRRQLVLFLGAGVSAAAGLPGWSELIKQLAKISGTLPGGETDEAWSSFSALNSMDQARIINDHFNRQERLMGREVAGLLAGFHHYSLQHAILAGLPVSEVVTTNYDTLFETASNDGQGARPAILPYERPDSGRQWLLKLHGCVQHHEDIVLTRSDYLRYNDKRAALRGIVQAMLITRHMLFAGFSLTDENFHTIIEDVRKTMRGSGKSADGNLEDRPFGTALMHDGNAFLEQIWKGDIDWLSFKRESSYDSSYRLQEIFLDYLASASLDFTAHLMDQAYDGVLSNGEKEVRQRIAEMSSAMSEEARQTAAWRQVQALVKSFGGQC